MCVDGAFRGPFGRRGWCCVAWQALRPGLDSEKGNVESVCVCVCAHPCAEMKGNGERGCILLGVSVVKRRCVCEFPRWRPRFPSCKFLESGLNLVSSKRKTTTRDSGWISCFSIGVCVCLWTGRINYSGGQSFPITACFVVLAAE